jgi:hypothetical protein
MREFGVFFLCSLFFPLTHSLGKLMIILSSSYAKSMAPVVEVTQLF